MHARNHENLINRDENCGRNKNSESPFSRRNYDKHARDKNYQQNEGIDDGLCYPSSES